MDRDGIEHRLDRRRPADRTFLGRRIGDALEQLEDVSLRTLVLVSRHGKKDGTSVIGLDTSEKR
jgi:hypothetical protein